MLTSANEDMFIFLLFSSFTKVLKLANLITPLGENAVGFAANLPGQQQTEALNLAKTVFESAALLVNASRYSCSSSEVCIFGLI